ncbi:response regulator transcription factor [Halarchaeum sp. P4]|uniref:response regulator transcription factor n=1 Tax=Halarchaeum sp. P4 TaxID=3421639 RepID=UPI003EBC2FA6
MSPDSSKPVVLAVEDDVDVLETYEIWLFDAYDVRTAETGDDAIKAFDDDIDAVVLDRMMPRTSGEDVLREFRERGYDAGVVMVSALEPDESVAALPFDAYLTKPIDKEELRAAVDAMVERADLDEARREHAMLAERHAALRVYNSDAIADTEAFEELEAATEAAAERHGEPLDADDLVVDLSSGVEPPPGVEP